MYFYGPNIPAIPGIHSTLNNICTTVFLFLSTPTKFIFVSSSHLNQNKKRNIISSSLYNRQPPPPLELLSRRCHLVPSLSFIIALKIQVLGRHFGFISWLFVRVQIDPSLLLHPSYGMLNTLILLFRFKTKNGFLKKELVNSGSQKFYVPNHIKV